MLSKANEFLSKHWLVEFDLKTYYEAIAQNSTFDSHCKHAKHSAKSYAKVTYIGTDKAAVVL